MALVGGEDLSVALGELRELVERLAIVLPHEEMPVVGEGRKKCGIFGVDLVAEAGKVEVANDALLKEAGEVGGCRHFVARPDLFGDAAAADQIAFFKDQNFSPGARKVGGGNHAVMTGANNDDV